MSMDIKSVGLVIGNHSTLTPDRNRNNSGQEFSKSLDNVENKKSEGKTGSLNSPNQVNKLQTLNQTDEAKKAEEAKKGKNKDSANDKDLKNQVNDLNESLTLQNLSIEFNVDKDIDQTIVKVVDKSTGEVIRQMPSKEMVDHLKHLKDLSNQDKANKLVGIILDKKV